jgi:hypothetical protein
MKTFSKILLAFSLVTAALIVTGFYITTERHAASVFPEKMNVFYIGVDNPIAVSMCSVKPQDTEVSITGGTLTPSGRPGSYIVRVSGGTESTINVLQRGNNMNLSSYKFRVKRVPDPVTYFGSIKGDGLMTKAELQSQSGIFPRMENFDFDLRFTVASFQMSALVDGAWKDCQANGPGITPEMKSIMTTVKTGDKVIFQNVTVKGPDGTIRKIPGVVVKVK